MTTDDKRKDAVEQAKRKIAALVESRYGGDWNAARAALAAKVAEIRAREEQKSRPSRGRQRHAEDARHRDEG